MYYLNSRYYNPEWGRFINADGIVGNIGELLSHNLFAYCENSPISGYDPSGYQDIADCMGGGGVADSLLALYVMVSYNPAITEAIPQATVIIGSFGNQMAALADMMVNGGYMNMVTTDTSSARVQSNATSKALTKAETNIIAKIRSEKSHKYWELNISRAKINGIYVNIPSIGRGLTEAAAIKRVKSGGSVLTIYQFDALKVSNFAGNGMPSMWHPLMTNRPGYFGHYHPGLHRNNAHVAYLVGL